MSTLQTNSNPASWSRLWRMGLLAAITAAVANTLLYFIARVLGSMPQSVVVPGPTGSGPLTPTSVIFMSLTAAVVATVLFVLLVRFTARPGRIFAVLAGLVYVGMLFGPLTIPEAPTGMIVALELMHIVTAATIVGLLFRALGRTREKVQ